MEQGIYELPLNERLRTFMRIEFLFNRLNNFSGSKDRWQIRTTMHTLLEIYTILARTDVRREVLADLDRYIIQMQRFQSMPDADNEMATNLLEDLNVIKNKMLQLGMGYLHPLRDDEYISALLHRHTLPGGKAEFDMPRYKFWLEGDPKVVNDDLNRWINVITPICGGIEKLLWIIRESSEPIGTVANGGQYNHQIGKTAQISLIRVFLDNSSIYPEISGGRHMIAIRFLERDAEGQFVQADKDIEFKLSLC
ncbi:MAG: cell division protein ZapD [Pseudomonadota bacterium]|nr:cell division protein ZapD [Pseudomonadota bacterium]